eukprot:COSAG04_NODE_4032_length_2352_cov_7.139370_1_plen_198_part_00
MVHYGRPTPAGPNCRAGRPLRPELCPGRSSASTSRSQSQRERPHGPHPTCWTRAHAGTRPITSNPRAGGVRLSRRATTPASARLMSPRAGALFRLGFSRHARQRFFASFACPPVTVLRLRVRPHPLLGRPIGANRRGGDDAGAGGGAVPEPAGECGVRSAGRWGGGGVAAVAPAAPGAAAAVRVWCSRITTMHIFIH